jgi:Outer membrane receptor proteins, mostly Fe transport
MKCPILVPVLLLCFCSPVWLSAQNASSSSLQDTIQLPELIVSSTKESARLSLLPASVSVLSQSLVERQHILSIKELSALSSNVYIPDYGSSLTSAVYVRGVGARAGAAAVAFYVDDVPYDSPASFDSDLFDIQRIEILKGPQGTLYGRNSLGGVIHVHTLSPLSYQGTRVSLLAGSRAFFQGAVSTYQKIGSKAGFSVGGQFRNFGGFFTNQFDGKKVDAARSAALRGRLEWQLSPRWRLGYSLNYDFSEQDGYAYGAYDKQSGKIAEVAYNDPALYRRHLFNTSLQLKHEATNWNFSLTTAYQGLSDTLQLDNDFSPASLFTLGQQQKQHSLSQEWVFSSKPGGRLSWVAGALGFFRHLETRAPVTLKDEFITVIEQMISAQSPFPIDITDESLRIEGQFDTPSWGAALFAQARWQDLLLPGLSLTAGLRADFEKAYLDASCYTDVNMKVPMSPQPVKTSYKIEGLGDMYMNPLLPKLALMYGWGKQSVYLSVSRGYKAGGYNIQMVSDLLQAQMSSRPGTAPEYDLQEQVSFKPEYSWNYELGGHLQSRDGRWSVDASLFYITLNDQQLVEFAPGGAGRMIKNAGRSASYGLEWELRVRPLRDLLLQFSYGYAYATFTEYKAQEQDGSVQDFSGKRLPFAPAHNLSASGSYRWRLQSSWLDAVVAGMQYHGLGDIYWTEQNDIRQKFYGLLHGQLTVQKGIFECGLWAKNLSNTSYASFYFESMGRAYAQKGKPLQFGLSVKVNIGN